MNNDLVMDVFGNVYKCWNYIFVKDANYTHVEDLIDQSNKVITPNSLKYINSSSLINVNRGICLSCKYITHCGGLCPDIRLKIKKGEEENVYQNNRCIEMIEKKLKQRIQLVLEDCDQ